MTGCDSRREYIKPMMIDPAMAVRARKIERRRIAWDCERNADSGSTVMTRHCVPG